jgi:two-component system, chemotaxis family, CheB/CheR fusion protein
MSPQSSPGQHEALVAPTEERDYETPIANHPFPVVGVGASAGGLEAFTALLEELPPDPGVALVFVVHMEAHHESHLAEILSRVTALSVRQVTEGMAVEVNHVYLIPPNTNMALIDGRLTLSPRSRLPGQHMPIDHLFRSLAAIQKNRAVGVILSGGGTDGTLGFQAIKAEGGITFAQDERSAKHSSMPRSAVLDGCVDYVLPPNEIIRELMRIARHPYAREAEAGPEKLAAEDTFREIVALLRATTNVDFSHYKRSTVQRRILRRMALLGLENLHDYLRRLSADQTELQNLYQDFLIRVTQFFREPEAFEAIKQKVLPMLIRQRSPVSPIRIWVVGCSTGEEVYSLAIALLEFLDDKGVNFPIKILATDLNDAALEKARAGVYVDNIEIDVSPERLRRFFIRGNLRYQINQTVRDLCVFSRHNMVSDPPFSHLDLVSCRNVLIYLDNALQRRVLPILHYALKGDGFLFLGASENIGPYTELFEVIDSKHRVFSKKPAVHSPPLDFGTFVSIGGRAQRGALEEGGPVWTALDVQREADRIVLARFAPVGVVVDEAGTVLQFRGRTAPFLEPAPGLPSLDLFRMLREGLLAEVRSALNQAKAEDVAVTREGVDIAEENRVRHVRVEVIPFKVPPAGARFFLVLFEDISPPAEAEPPAQAAPVVSRPQVPDQQRSQLQQELAAMREYLQSVIEEQESTNEELKAANEEILSANEELQSTNEELQTAKEEAQSANEELATVNEELRHRNAELGSANNDLINLLSGVNIPIVMVTRDLRIRRFTPLAEKLFNLIPTDLGRPISDIKPNLNVADMAKLIAQVIDTLSPHDGELQDSGGHWYSLRIRPYITAEGKIDGASLVLLDINAYKSDGQKRSDG